MKPDSCPCGEPMLADTEDWETPLCDNCLGLFLKTDPQKRLRLVGIYADELHMKLPAATKAVVAAKLVLIKILRRICADIKI